MKKIINEKGLWVFIVALFLTGTITLLSALMPNLTSPLSNVIGVVTSPFQTVTASFTGWVEHMYDYAFRYEQLEAKLSEAEKQLAEARSQLRKAQDALDENDDLRAALNLTKAKTELTLMDVTVTAPSSTSWESTMRLSKGSNVGIEVGDTVITGTGYLVGVVKEVGVNWSTMITLLDPDISISAMIYRTGESAMLESDLNLMEEGKCKLSYLAEESTLINGDTVMTSGANGTYPSGLVIGYIDTVQIHPSGLERYGVIEPAASMEDLNLVFVVTDFDKES
ncbi:MAG: rod shape-determining protein MreC [Oscillospiraceae bacterium]|nr:rod shape-determining protein MreC [Oscillospiraceae bacterium]